MTSDASSFPPPRVDRQISFAVAMAVRDHPGRVLYMWCSPGETELNADVCDHFMTKVVESDAGPVTVSPSDRDGKDASYVRVGEIQVSVHRRHAVALGAWLMLYGPGSDRLAAAHNSPDQAI